MLLIERLGFVVLVNDDLQLAIEFFYFSSWSLANSDVCNTETVLRTHTWRATFRFL